MTNTQTRILLAAALGLAVAVLAIVAIQGSADAISTRSFVLDDAASLAAGELDGTAVHSNGSVTAGAAVRRIPFDEVPVAWCFARGRNGTAYIGTGSDGKIYRLAGDALTEFAETGQLVVTAIAVADDGTVFAGTLPEGRIYRIDPQGQVSELVQPDGAEHIWSLVWDEARNRLFAATGSDGKVFAIDRQGRAEVYWDSDAGHVMALALDPEGVLYAGTDGDALVVRIRAPGRAEVVYDFPGNEITALAVRDGVLAVAANEFPAPPPTSSKATKATTRRPNPGKGRLFRVEADGRTRRIYRNDNGHFTSVQIADDGTVYAGSGKDGRVYRVAPDETSSTWIDVDERQVLGIDLVGNDPMFITGDAAAVYRVVGDRSEASVWTSKALDARFLARFGNLNWRGEGGITFQTRSGNREAPDDTWSEWSQPMNSPGPVRSPAGRFLQIRARFPADGTGTIRAVTAYYLPQNQRARVHSVGFAPAKAKNKNKNKGSGTGLPSPSSRYKLSWKVQNDDEDRLRYRLRYREEGQSVWRDMLRESEILTKNQHTWETSAVPDGYYVVEVAASDELENPAGRAEISNAQSEPLLIDNHAPRIEGLQVRGTVVSGRAIDGLGPISRLEFAVDGGEWQLFFPQDDLFDSPEERFEVDVGPLEPGSHIVAVRAYDAGGNPVTGEVSLTVR
ncbi:MAG: hypothetical protein AAGF12_24700 [Myxococcota bacterium]